MNISFFEKLVVTIPILLCFLAIPVFSAEMQDAVTGATQTVPFIRNEEKVFIPESSPLRKTLNVATVESRSVEHQIDIPGVVEADPGKLMKVLSRVLGRIIKIHKGLGDPVKKGEPLFSLDSAEIAQYHSEAVNAKSAFELAKRHLDRQKELNEAGITPRKELEQAEHDYKHAEGEVERTTGRLSQLGCAPGRGNGRLFTLSSPISGRVIELAASSGGFWNDLNAPLLTIADLSTLWIAASVPEQEIAAIKVGQAAKITVNAFPDENPEGNVKYINELLDTDTRTVKVRIAINNQSGHYRPGMFAKVRFACQAHSSLVVPASSLVQSGFNTRVFKEVSPWTFEPRTIKTGSQVGDMVEVVSGLQSGDRVVVKDGVLLND